MKTSEAGIKLIQNFEGCRLQAYRCPAGVWTVGYGSTENVCEGMTITMNEAVRRLQDHLVPLEVQVEHLVKVPLNQSQFDAIIAFCYNCGIGAFERSSLLKLLNNGHADLAADAFLAWNKCAGHELSGLTRRRQAERELFLKG